MPAEVPGYYFDAEKNRYFKIQANHIAPSGSKYSRGAVNAEKVIEKRQHHEEALRRSKEAATVTRSAMLYHPLLSFDRRLGDRRRAAAASIAEYYATSLDDGKDVFNQVPPPNWPFDGSNQGNPRTGSGQFAIEESTGTMFADISIHERHEACQLMACHRSGNFSAEESILRQSADWPVCSTSGNSYRGRLYHNQCQTLIGVYSVKHIAALGSQRVLWVEERHWRTPNVTHLATSAYSGAGSLSQLGVTVDMSWAGGFIRDVAAMPDHHIAALGTDKGLSLVDSARWRILSHIKLGSEQMATRFKDEHILMTGARSGKLRLTDTRLSGQHRPTVLRLQHSCAISGIRPLSDGNRVLVNGLADMKIYDLRFAPEPTKTTSTSTNPPPEERHTTWRTTRHSKRRQRDPAPPLQPHQHAFATTPAVLTFNVPPTRRQNRYGLGFAYDAELDIVLSASTDHHNNHRVGLWSASTGQLLRSPLNDRQFASRVTCADFARVRDGPKSILLAYDHGVTEFCAQGRGYDSDEDDGDNEDRDRVDS